MNPPISPKDGNPSAGEKKSTAKSEHKHESAEPAGGKPSGGGEKKSPDWREQSEPKPSPPPPPPEPPEPYVDSEQPWAKPLKGAT
jgi:hypothetical protein